MGDKSAIQWTDATWNPITGCSKVSPGCAYCYAERVSTRYGRTTLPWIPANAAANVRLHPGVLLLPSGRSAHLEAGYFIGAGKPLHILLPELPEPELMYRMASSISLTIGELLERLGAAVPA